MHLNTLKSSTDVELNIVSTESECKIEIIDYGIGIQKDQDKLFNTFYRRVIQVEFRAQV
jgi:signal transduction histidine kinase